VTAAVKPPSLRVVGENVDAGADLGLQRNAKYIIKAHGFISNLNISKYIKKCVV
jgi:hypothetical protein